MTTLETSQPTTPARPSLWWLRWLMLGLLLVAIVLAYALLPLKEWLLALARELQSMGPIAVLVYAVTYVVACLFILPAALMSIGAGATWGTLGGFATALPSATLAALAAFTCARYFFSGRFRDWLLTKPRLRAVERAVNDKGAALVFLLRLSPMLPFPVLNYIFGLTRIPYRKFTAATFFGMMPITCFWAYVGAIGASASTGTAEIAIGIAGGVITLAVTWWVGRAARKALRESAA